MICMIPNAKSSFVSYIFNNIASYRVFVNRLIPFSQLINFHLLSTLCGHPKHGIWLASLRVCNKLGKRLKWASAWGLLCAVRLDCLCMKLFLHFTVCHSVYLTLQCAFYFCIFFFLLIRQQQLRQQKASALCCQSRHKMSSKCHYNTTSVRANGQGRV